MAPFGRLTCPPSLPPSPPPSLRPSCCCSMSQFWSVVLPFTFASPLGIFIGFVISDLATGAGAAAISALASGERALSTRPSKA